MHSQIIRAECLGEIRQFLAVVVARVTGDVEWHESIFVRVVFGGQHADYGALVDDRCHWDGVVSWFENQVVQVGLTHGGSGDGEVECEVSLLIELVEAIG